MTQTQHITISTTLEALAHDRSVLDYPLESEYWTDSSETELTDAGRQCMLTFMELDCTVTDCNLHTGEITYITN
jgi:hypothetical protein